MRKGFWADFFVSILPNLRILDTDAQNPAIYHRADPDAIVGHDFLGVSLDILLYRMRELKVDHWSRIGRFRRSKWPFIGKQGTNLRFLNGRLVCDLASDAAKVRLQGFSLCCPS
jgi:DNA polymerase elongation subunit (family B)